MLIFVSNNLIYLPHIFWDQLRIGVSSHVLSTMTLIQNDENSIFQNTMLSPKYKTKFVLCFKDTFTIRSFNCKPQINFIKLYFQILGKKGALRCYKITVNPSWNIVDVFHLSNDAQ